MNLLSKKTFFSNDASSGSLILTNTQVLPDSYLENLRLAREASLSQPMGETHRFASIPQAVADKWIQDGFDFYKAKPSEIIARLKTEGLDCLVTTNRTL